jgi:O-antigen/teichoic acid export membrane protein
LLKFYKKYKTLFAVSKYILWLNITDKIFWLAILLFIARIFALEIYGQTVTLIAFCTIFITIFELGLPIYMQREAALNKALSSEVFSRIFILSLALFLIYFSISSLFYYIIYYDISFKIFSIIAVMMYISSLLTLTSKALNGLNEYKKQFHLFFVVRIAIALLIIGTYWYKTSIEMILLIITAGLAVNLILNLLLLKKYSIAISVKNFAFSKAITLIKYSLPLGLAVIFNFLYDKLDIILISKLTDYYNAGYYNAAYGIYKTSSIIFSFLLVAGFTKVSEMKNDYLSIKEFLNQHIKIISYICLTAALVIFIFANLIINIFYTEKFSSSVFILRILSLGIIAMGLNNLTGTVINAMGYFRIVMYVTLYGLIFNVLLNIIYIPLYGIAASAVITVLTEILIFGAEFYFIIKLFKEKIA